MMEIKRDIISSTMVLREVSGSLRRPLFLKWPLAQETGYSQTRKNCDGETCKSANKHIFSGTNLFCLVQFPETEYGFGSQQEPVISIFPMSTNVRINILSM